MTLPDDLPKRLSAAIQSETQGERIRWLGRPSSRAAFSGGMLIWLFAVPWTAFALFWTAGALGLLSIGKAAAKVSAMNWAMGLFGLPFILVGLAMLAAPFGLARSARNTVHVITEKRLLTITANRVHTRVKTLWPADLVSIERTERPDGSGSLKLVLGSHRDSDGDKQTTSEAIGAVPDVRRAEQLLAAMRGDKRAA
jgi:hypothetical protein